MNFWTIGTLALALAGCSNGMRTDAGDAARDAIGDGTSADASLDGADGTSTGEAGSDVVRPGDGGGDDVQGSDVASDTVGPGPDVLPPADTGAGADVITPGDGGCSGTLGVTVTAPTSGGMIETCTAGGMAVYYNFTATTTGTGVTSVTFNWRNPDGDLVSPTTPIRTGPPFVARRQVGGIAVVGGAPSLAVAGGRNAIGGTWRLEVAAMDSCGRVATATQPFTLTFARTGCPNP